MISLSNRKDSSQKFHAGNGGEKHNISIRLHEVSIDQDSEENNQHLHSG